MCRYNTGLRGRDDSVGWTVRGSNPGGGEIFLTGPDRPRGPPSLLYNEYQVSSQGLKWLGRRVETNTPF